ncbi:hypothetical protein [Pedobacter agri]|uniref:hypothetical protein n=1 Tax=Pedobacter agri TaxID=454586 RepID=UPI002930DC17|nr:hypothetical protein [Pedobacter agri]
MKLNYNKNFFKKVLLAAAIILIMSDSLKAQIKYSAKLEAGHLYYGTQLIRYERTENYSEDFITEERDGNEINLVNGLAFNKFLFAGIGIGYLNLSGTKGFTASLDTELLVSRKKLSPLINFKIGQSFLKNDMGRNKSSTFGEFEFGLNYRFIPVLSTYVKAGIQITQNTSFLAVRGGVRF